MMGHDEYTLELADYVTGRLDVDRARGVEAHLRDCPECARWVGGVRKISGAVRDGGEVLFDAHPTTARLRVLALSGTSATAAEIHHIEACARCSLERDAWRLRAQGLPPAPPVRRPWWAAPALAAGVAAVLLIGGGLGYLARGMRVPTPAPMPPPAQVPPPVAAPPEAAAPESLARSLPTIHLMSFRGGSQARTFEVDSDAAFVSILVQAAIPPDVPDGVQVKAEIRRKEGAAVWSSSEERAGRLRRALEASDVFGYVVPGDLLPPGSYELTIRRVDEESGELLVRISFEILRPD